MKLLWVSCLLFFLGVSSVQAEEAHSIIDDYVVELDVPKTNEIIDWVPEEVPRTVTFYIDADGDGFVDIKIAYSLIEAFPCKQNCVSEITDNGDHWILPAPGINYYVIKEWILYRYADDKDWRFPYKTNEWIFKYPYNDDWLEHKFYPLWPQLRIMK